MLSAFTARPIIELKQRDKSKIETILAYGDRILVGLNTGSLRVYRLNELHVSSKSESESYHNGTSSFSRVTGHPDQNQNHTRTDPTSQRQQPPPKKPTDLLREVEKFSPRAIEQLAIIKEANTIISLSNYNVSLHDLQTYEPLEAPLPRTKNASCFAVTSNIVKDPTTGIPEIISRLAVAVRRRLLLWSWHESELSDDVAEITLQESIRSVTWASANKVVCGMNGGYVLVDVRTHEAEDVVVPPARGAPADAQPAKFGAVSGSAGMGYMGLGGYVPKPLAARLGEGELLLAKDVNTLFIETEDEEDEEGAGAGDRNGSTKPVIKKRRRHQIPWQAAPESIGYSYPYILALQPPSKGQLEVWNPDTLSSLQSIPLSGAARLHFPPPNVSLAHAGKGFHISSERSVWKMGATDYDSQIKELVDAKQYDEAVSILGMLEDALLKDKAGTVREVKMLKAEALFAKKRFRDSMDLFNEDDVYAPPERVLRLYPPSIAGELSGWNRPDSDVDEEGQDNGEIEASGEGDESHKRPANGKDKNKTDSEETDAGASSPVKSIAGGGTGRFANLFKGSLMTQSDSTSISSKKQGDSNTDEDSSSVGVAGKPNANPHDEPLAGKELFDAIHALTGYLVGTRTRLQGAIDPVTGKLRRTDSNGSGGPAGDALLRNFLSHSSPDEPDREVEGELQRVFRLADTALFRAYMYWKPTLAGSLFRIPNFCDPDVVNEKLIEHNRFTELVDFFYGKKLHAQALELLKKFSTEGKSAGEENRGSKSERRDDDTEDEEENYEDAVPAALRGPQRAVAYLQSLPPSDIDLILEHSRWTLAADPELAMEVFVADTENAETLPRDRVVKFLGDVDGRLEVQYLEHIIGELDDLTPDFHNRLLELYVKDLRGRQQRREEGNGTEEGKEWEGEMERFVAFLKESRQYSLGKALGLIPRDNEAFYEAQAVVYSNMGSHKQALEIYVFKMKDYTKAEDYCNRIHRSDDSRSPSPDRVRQASSKAKDGAARGEKDDTEDDGQEQPSIHHTLLSLYLSPPPPHEQAFGPALDLLSRHGSRLPAASTLSLIPDSLPVRDLEAYFRGRIRSANSVVNESRIVAGLRATEYISSQALLLLGDGVPGGQGGRNRRVVVTDERLCGVCHKRLGGSVVSVMPDNAVVHYGCSGKVATGGQGQSQGQYKAGSWGRLKS